MRKQIALALLCAAISTTALAGDAYNPPPQVLSTPVTSYQKGQAERLRQEQMRLENERIRQEIERNRQEAQRQERLRLQNEERNREQAALVATQQDTKNGGLSSDTEMTEMIEQLRKLAELKDGEYVTEEEYQELKTKVLDGYE